MRFRVFTYCDAIRACERAVTVDLKTFENWDEVWICFVKIVKAVRWVSSASKKYLFGAKEPGN